MAVVLQCHLDHSGLTVLENPLQDLQQDCQSQLNCFLNESTMYSTLERWPVSNAAFIIGALVWGNVFWSRATKRLHRRSLPVHDGTGRYCTILGKYEAPRCLFSFEVQKLLEHESCLTHRLEAAQVQINIVNAKFAGHSMSLPILPIAHPWRTEVQHTREALLPIGQFRLWERPA